MKVPHPERPWLASFYLDKDRGGNILPYAIQGRENGLLVTCGRLHKEKGAWDGEFKDLGNGEFVCQQGSSSEDAPAKLPADDGAVAPQMLSFSSESFLSPDQIARGDCIISSPPDAGMYPFKANSLLKCKADVANGFQICNHDQSSCINVNTEEEKTLRCHLGNVGIWKQGSGKNEFICTNPAAPSNPHSASWF